ncbi:MAG: hypothetical protein HQ507_06850 [Candidatus Marinimicrobia bacterium]|nr:hypothetical protein [Candidatus Neomarinimicrobiota bacterium]
MTLSAKTRDRILTEILHDKPQKKPDTKEEKEFRESLMTENAQVFKELERAEALFAVAQLWLRENAKKEGMSEDELNEEMPLPYSNSQMKRFQEVFKAMETGQKDEKTF